MEVPHLEVSGAVWLGFNTFVVALLLVDLYGFNRRAHKITFREALRTSAFFVGAALFVNALIWIRYGSTAGLTFFTGYLVEMSLSVDNLFVIAMLFGYFAVPPRYQHRVLFWGVFGAIVMRATMILAGVALVDRFAWVLYIFGVFLVLTGGRMLFADSIAEPPKSNKILHYLRRVLPVTEEYHSDQFVIRKMGVTMVTPLFLVLVMIELTDVVFAFDSIPAIIGITTDPFLAYGSNIMAVVGLRALFFVLSGLIERIRYLHIGLGLILVFIGLKLLVADRLHIPTWISLIVIATLIGGSALLSWFALKKSKAREPQA